MFIYAQYRLRWDYLPLWQASLGIFDHLFFVQYNNATTLSDKAQPKVIKNN